MYSAIDDSGPVDEIASAAVIQAAARGRKSRTAATRTAAWLTDLANNSRIDPRALGQLGGGKQSVPAPLLGNINRASALRAVSERVARERAQGAGGFKPGLPEAARRPAVKAGSNGRGRGRTGGPRLGVTPMPIREPELRRATREFIANAILSPIVDRAAKQGEAILAARARQAEFELRPLQKPVCTASLFGTGPIAGDGHSRLHFIEQDGLGLLTSRAELLKLSMHSAPLPQLGLHPLVQQSQRQAAELPSTARLHSVAVDAASARVFALHVDGCMMVWGGRHGELRHSAQVRPQPPTHPPTPSDEHTSTDRAPSRPTHPPTTCDDHTSTEHAHLPADVVLPHPRSCCRAV